MEELKIAMENNDIGFPFEAVQKVLAYVEGEHDEAAYHWIVLVQESRLGFSRPVDTVYYITGQCDFTGWDCHSSLSAVEFDLLAMKDLLQQVETGVVRPDFYQRVEMTDFVKGEW